MTRQFFLFFSTGLLVLMLTAVTGFSSVKPATRHHIVKRTPNPVFADGKLDEPVWQKCARIKLEEKNGGPTQQSTYAMMAWDDRFLYIAFDCQDSHIWGTLTQHDDPIYNEEVVEIFIDADSDGETYVEFEISPLGVFFDGYLLNRQGKRNLILAWNSKLDKWGVQLKGTLNDPSDTDTGWTVELAVALEDIVTGPNTPPKAGDKWRLNLYRIDRPGEKTFEGSAWSPVSGGTYHDPDCFGEIEFSDEILK